MRAARFHGPGDLRIEDVPRPQPGPGETLVEVEVALTDGTDLKTYRRGHPLLLAGLPSPFGHEFCGIAGGRRVVAPNSAAGEERDGPIELLNGAYAEALLVPETIPLLPVPDGLAPETAAMVEPLACCLRGVELAGVEADQTVAILGAGPIGLMLAACVADAGATPVIVGGRPERRALAPLFGARDADPTGADVAIEAVGTQQAWQDAVVLVRPQGTVLLFGGLERDATVPIDAYRVHYEELTLRGAFHHTPRHVRAALAFLASGAHPWERLVTHRIALDELPALFAEPPRELLKAAVYP